MLQKAINCHEIFTTLINFIESHKTSEYFLKTSLWLNEAKDDVDIFKNETKF